MLFSQSNPKFIVNNGNLILGHVGFHRELARDHSKTVGGGWFLIDKPNKKLHLYDQSIDFGPCTRQQVYDAVHNGLLDPNLEDFEIYFTNARNRMDAIALANPENRIK